MFSYLCTYARNKIAHCPPAVRYIKYSWYTRYPKEKSQFWNLANIITPVAWMFTLLSMFTITLFAWISKSSLNKLGLKKSISIELTLIPFR